jgi:four helix bundle protein
MKQIKTFKDLLIWQKAMQMVTNIYTTTKSFPKDEMYGLTSQIRRAAVAIPSNIAEGYGRNHTKEYIQFLYISISSLYELQTQLEIALNIQYINEGQFKDLFETSREVERMTSAMIKTLKNKIGA